MSEKTMTAAINEAIDQEMARDDRVFVAGEDVRVGGPFGTEAGLHAKYGDQRIVNTAISELALTGLGVGSAAVGLRPIIEIMIMDFVTVAMDQIVRIREGEAEVEVINLDRLVLAQGGPRQGSHQGH